MTNFLQKINQKIRYGVQKYFGNINWFDIVSNVDTVGRVDKEKLYDSIDSENKNFMNRYVPTHHKQLKEVLEHLIAYDKTVLDNTFVDFGCGKGRVLIMAERMGFRNIIGVEFSEKLYTICKNNLNKIKSVASDVVHADAVDFNLYGDMRVFYFYNPFEFKILEKVLDKINNFLKGAAKVGYVVYIDPRSFGVLNPAQYALIHRYDGPLTPYHIYKVII